MKFTELLDQIDRLEGELLPDWKYNDRTGAVIANAYRKQGDKWSCLVAKDIPADCDAEFIALARTALPQLAKALRAVMEVHTPEEFSDHNGDGVMCNECMYDDGTFMLYPCPTVQAITDAIGENND